MPKMRDVGQLQKRADDVKERLESVVPLLLGVGKNVDMEPHQKAMLDAVYNTLIECVSLLKG